MPANPSICCDDDSVTVGCCPNPVPETMTATIQNPPGCTGSSGPLTGTVSWIPAIGEWQGNILVCSVALNIYLRCQGTGVNSFGMGIDWDDTGTCQAPEAASLNSGSCDPFYLSFTTWTQEVRPDCPCCVGAVIQFTIEFTD